MKNQCTEKQALGLAIFLEIYFALLIGIWKLDTIFFFQLQDDLNASTTQISLLYSLANGLFFVAGPLYGAFFKIFGARVSLLTTAVFCSSSGIFISLCYTYSAYLVFFSITRSIGTGMGFVIVHTITGMTFTTSLSLVNNLYAGVASVLVAAMAPFVQFSIDTYTWKGSMLLLGGILLNMLPLGWISATLCEKQMDTAKEKLALNNIRGILLASFDLHLLKDELFMIYCLANSFVQFPRVLHAMYLVRYAQSIGVHGHAASALLTMYQIPYVLSSILVGAMCSKMAAYANRKHKPVLIRTSTIIIISTLCQCFVNFLPIFWETYQSYAIYTVLSGIFIGACGSQPITILPEFFGKDHLASAIGYRGLTFGLINFTIPPLIGRMIDASGTYRAVLYGATIIAFIGIVLFYVLQKLIDKRNVIEKN